MRQVIFCQKLYGLSYKLSDATISDRLKRCTIKQTSEYMDVIGKLSGKVHNKLQTKSDILNFDSSVSIVYGNQEEQRKDTMIKKRVVMDENELQIFNFKFLIILEIPGTESTRTNQI